MREETIGQQRLICGDCLDVLPTLPENSVDLIATDPPYALSDAHRKGNGLFEVLAKIGFPQFAEEVARGNGGAATGLVPFLLSDPLRATGGTCLSAGVNVASNVIDLNEHVEFGDEEVGDVPPPALSIIEGELPAVCDAEGGKCLGYFVLKFGMLEEGSVCDPQGRTAAGFFSGGFWYHVRLADHALTETEGTAPIVAIAGAELPSVLSLDCGGGTADLLPADGAGEPDRDFLLSCPQLVRASSAAGGLTAPLQALRVSIVDRLTNRAGALHFHLLVPPNLWDSIRPIIAHKGFMGKAWDGTLPNPAVWRECLRVLKPGGSAVVMSGSRLDCLWRMCRDLEEAGFELQTTAMFWAYRTGFGKGQDLSKAADARAGAEREVTRTWTGGQRSAGILGENLGTQSRGIGDIPATDLARDLDGWFTKGKVKPAVEVIIWARKPNSERTELDNMVKHGVGGVNCGACMVPFESDELCVQSGETVSMGRESVHAGYDRPNATMYRTGKAKERTGPANPAGRFPANLLCTDEALGAEDSRYFSVDAWAAEHGYSDDWAAAAEAGLLQVAKPSRAEKNAGCEGLPQEKTFRVNAGGREAKGADGDWDDVTQRWITQPQGNRHPTCKPVTLFAYLIEFLTRPGAVVLDPFLGSGTTLVAATATGRAGIGIELSAEYAEIAAARLRHAQPAQLALAAE